ncbi:hypothetical protein [Sphingopyxis sp.]|jgi:hypothetical protein|uniref:hypothetical protein n=1 Tax=Sphingomonadales TaxID=204457 RepID=UPI003F721611
MADRVAASITIGGSVTGAEFITLYRLIAAEDLTVGEDGDPFSPGDWTDGEPLKLFDHQAIGGQFEALEAWCVQHGLPFSRWCAGFPGGWEPERVVFTGTGAIETYPATENGNAIATRDNLDLHESLATLHAWFAAAHFEIPPLEILADIRPTISNITRASAGQEERRGGGSEHCSQLEKGSAQ